MTAPNTFLVQTGSLGQDASMQPIQSATKWDAQDATPSTTIKSPLAVSSTEIDMVVPVNAVTIVCSPVGADVRVANTDAGTATAPYRVIKDGTTLSLPVANMTDLHFLRDASTNLTLHFHFEFVG